MVFILFEIFAKDFNTASKFVHHPIVEFACLYQGVACGIKLKCRMKYARHSDFNLSREKTIQEMRLLGDIAHEYIDSSRSLVSFSTFTAKVMCQCPLALIGGDTFYFGFYAQ